MASFQIRIRRVTLSLIILLLATFSVLLYAGLSTLLYRHVDADLLSRAQTEAKEVELATGHLDAVSHEEAHEDDERGESYEEHELREAIRFSRVLSLEGDVIWTGESVGARTPLGKSSLGQIVGGNTIYESISRPQDSPLRRLSLPIQVEDKVQYILQTETSLRSVDDTLRWLILVLGGGSAAVILLAWIGSGWLSREALSPVEELSATAAQISGHTLRTRLSLQAPYEEFQRLAHTFNGMLDRLQKVFDAQRRFVADAAHELKTPLTAMKGNLEVTLQKARSPDEYREAIISNLGEVERLTGLTKSLLTLAQFSGDRPPIEIQPLELESLVQEVVGELSVLAETGNKHLTTDFHPIPPISGDASQLKQALLNLLDNALRHTLSGGTITVHLNSMNGHIALAVEDTGPGIPPQHLPYIFERFYRVDQSRDRNSGGTGLGLAIVKEIIEAHGGYLQVRSDVGQGTIVTMNLPTGDSPKGEITQTTARIAG